MQIHFHPVHGVLHEKKKKKRAAHSLCVCVSAWLRYHARDMKAINLGFSHGSADAQNRFQQKEKEKKKYLHSQLQRINLLEVSQTKLVLSRNNYQATRRRLAVNVFTELCVKMHFHLFCSLVLTLQMTLCDNTKHAQIKSVHP